MKNDTKNMKRLAYIFINMGNIHINSISSMFGYYEPKISPKLLNKLKKQDE